MIDLDLEVCRSVANLYKECHEADIANRDHFDSSDPRKYIASFEDYKKDYAPLAELDLVVLDPAMLGYKGERNGVCHDLLVHLLGLGAINWREFYIRLLSYPRLDSPNNGCIVAYNASFNGLSCVFHLGQFVDGRVISKFTEGPIFQHGIHQNPFFHNDPGVVHRVDFRKVD